MTDTSGTLPPAGWYPDPYGSPQERWWDGTGWTQHMNTAAPAAPVAPAAPAQPEPVAYTPPAQPEPVAYTPPAQPEPAAYTPPVQPAYTQPEPVAYTPPALQEPVAPAADPFAGFVSPTTAETAPQAPAQTGWPAATTTGPIWDAAPQALQQPAYTPPTQGFGEQDPFPAPSAYTTGDPFAARPATQDPAFTQPAEEQPFGGGSFFAQDPAPAAAAPAAAAGSFDFGFGDIIAGGPAASSGATPAAGDDSGLFGSWEPNEYTEPARNSLATAGLTLGILSFVLSAITGVPGIILSALGLSRASRSDREGDGPVGRGKAIAGLAVSVIGTAASIALIIYGLPLLQGLQNQAAVDPNGDGTTTLTDVETTANGGIALAVGDIGTITLPDSSDAAIQFSVTSITPNFTCTAEDAAGPENGQFIAVAMNFTLAAEYPTRMVDGAQLSMNQSDWIGYDAEKNQVQSTDAAVGCLPDDQQPGSFVPGESATITVVLDMTPTVTSVSWSPSGVTNLDPGITRWEWALA